MQAAIDIDRAFDRINLTPFRIIHLPLSAFAFPGFDRIINASLDRAG